MSQRLYVAGFPYPTTETELRGMFEAIGVVNDVKIITDRETGRSRGFGFIEMEYSHEAAEAIRQLDETELGGRSLKVAEAKERQQRR